MASLIRVGSGGKLEANEEALTELGFLNVPTGVWQMNTSSSGSSVALDHETVIPLVGWSFGHAQASNTNGTATANASVSINGKKIASLNGRKVNHTGAGYGNCVNATNATAVYYPYFYNNDLTACMNNINYTGGVATEQIENRSSAVYRLYAWLKKVG